MEYQEYRAQTVLMPWPTKSLWIEQCVASAKVRIGNGQRSNYPVEAFSTAKLYYSKTSII
jgi:hypothetical protein